MVINKTMVTVPGGYHLALDRDIDDAHPADYAFGPDASGKWIISGGHLTEVTSQMKNGVLGIENPGKEMYMNIRTENGGGSAPVYRQCFGPVTTLLLVVDALDRMGTRADWLWVKSGKQAGK
jgi:hypothetical protein